MDTTKQGTTQPLPGDRSDLDCFEVETRWSTWLVSTTMARHIEDCLERPDCPWVVFVDVVGSRIRCRVDVIVAIVESTVEQRQRFRERNRRLRQERNADGVWDE